MYQNKNENQNENKNENLSKSYLREDAKKSLNNRYESLKHDFNINPTNLLYFICELQNWGLFKQYNTVQFSDWFRYNKADFYERLQVYIANNKQAVKDAVQTCMFLVNNNNDLRVKTYYTDFLDDLYSLTGFIIKPRLYNFFTPSVQSQEGERIGALVIYQAERMKNDFEYRSKFFRQIAERLEN